MWSLPREEGWPKQGWRRWKALDQRELGGCSCHFGSDMTRNGNAPWDFQHESHMPGGGEMAEMRWVQDWRLVRSLLQRSKQQGGTWTAEGA